MKRATQRSAYRHNLSAAPAGVVTATIDSDTGLLAGPLCENTRREYFVAGTQPKVTCPHDIPPVDMDEDDKEFVPVAYIGEKAQ